LRFFGIGKNRKQNQKNIDSNHNMKSEPMPNRKQELKAKATDLENLIDYQEGSVVSRTLIDKKTGTVTLFAFAENQGLSEHTAPYDAIVHVLDGEAEVTISGKLIKVKQGEITIMPANQPHALEAKTRFKMLLTMIKS
jgi:quercetin dioxygenase-like cupin family protein